MVAAEGSADGDRLAIFLSDHKPYSARRLGHRTRLVVHHSRFEAGGNELVLVDIAVPAPLGRQEPDASGRSDARAPLTEKAHGVGGVVDADEDDVGRLVQLSRPATGAF